MKALFCILHVRSLLVILCSSRVCHFVIFSYRVHSMYGLVWIRVKACATIAHTFSRATLVEKCSFSEYPNEGKCLFIAYIIAMIFHLLNFVFLPLCHQWHDEEHKHVE